MRIIAADAEANGYLEEADKVWLWGGTDVETGEEFHFEPFRSEKETRDAILWSESVDLWVGHNFVSYDGPLANRILKSNLVDLRKVIDTYVVSRTVKYDLRVPKGCRKGPHSLEAYGLRFGMHKGHFDKFDEWSEEMVDYWKQDLRIQKRLYEHLHDYIWDPDWKRAFRCEHDIQIELDQQKIYGFNFNSDKAKGLLKSIIEEKTRLEEEIQQDYPPQLQHVHTINYTIKKDGEEGVHVIKAKEKYPLTKVEGDSLECYDHVPFNPGSPKQRIEKLWEAGWKPFEKTKTHQQFSRKKVGDPYGKSVTKMSQEFYDNKKENLEYYGWTCGEDNLATLPANAPNAARKLAQWLTLEGRRSSLVEWLGQVKEDGRIHGTTFGIGAWTGRMAHQGPNTANIASVWPSKKPTRTAVDEIKKRYDTDMRSCWDVPEGSFLVGVDAEGIQLRILGDQIWRHFGEREYADTIVNGDKEKETDIHNVNKRALGLENVDRDDAKTFIYAWVLNAGIPKVASILHTNVPTASKARDRFEASIPGLKPFKAVLLPKIAEKKWFKGYDGRKVVVPSLHKTLAGILQNGEAVVMKHARLKWVDDLRRDMINHKPVGLIHDEFQTEVIGTKEEAEHVKQVQIKSIEWAGEELGFLCPLAGSGSIGLNWAETH